MDPVRITSAGDSAISCKLPARIDPATSARAIALADAIEARFAGRLRDVVVGYCSVTVYFDPLDLDTDTLVAAIRRITTAPPRSASVESREIHVDVCYGGEYGPDLSEVAAYARASADDVVALHTSVTYRVYMLGFLPGFAYMATVDPRLALPRRATPRLRVAAGSVALAAGQTGIYPSEAPGGWHVIGLYSRRAVSAPARRAFPVSARRSCDLPRDRSCGVRAGARIMASLKVVRPGMLTTVQDLGRWGHQSNGVPVAGPMDVYSHRRANRLAGNRDGLAALEVTIVGPELQAIGDAVCAVAGAEFALTVDGHLVDTASCFGVPDGARVRFGNRRVGARAALAVRGGFDVPSAFGSRATSLVSRMGPFGGRALKAGDELPVGTAVGCTQARSGASALGLPAGGARLRVLMGPHDDRFHQDVISLLLGSRFTVAPDSNRMGYRLAGPSLHCEGAAEMLSDATPMGSIQVTGSGQPILLMADCQTTGGYPRIATVISADLPLAGQLAPGDWIEFTACARDDAVQALRQQEFSLELSS